MRAKVVFETTGVGAEQGSFLYFYTAHRKMEKNHKEGNEKEDREGERKRAR